MYTNNPYLQRIVVRERQERLRRIAGESRLRREVRRRRR